MRAAFLLLLLATAGVLAACDHGPTSPRRLCEVAAAPARVAFVSAAGDTVWVTMTVRVTVPCDEAPDTVEVSP